MKSMDIKFTKLREEIRTSHMYVMNNIYLDTAVDLCFFCGTPKHLTKEHVIPKWTFKNDSEISFNTTANGLGHKFIGATIPACNSCNSLYLSSIEYRLKWLLENVNHNDFYNEDIDLVIWWLQCISYKLQVFDFRKKIIKPKGMDFSKEASELPLALFRQDGKVDELNTFFQLDVTRFELTKKLKPQIRNSLVLYKTTNKENHFFHKVDDFIFVEIAHIGYAFFLFFNIMFPNKSDASTLSKEIINEYY